MSDRPTIVAISGSQADDSKTRLALQRALKAAEEAGAGTELIDIRTMDLPTFDSDDQEAGDAPQFREAVRRGSTRSTSVELIKYHPIAFQMIRQEGKRLEDMMFRLQHSSIQMIDQIYGHL